MNQDFTIDEAESRQLLQRLKAETFDGDNEKVALALGRPVDEIDGWLAGGAEIDEDAQMKIHGIAKERLTE